MLNEQQLEDQCLAWFQQAGWHYAHGPDIAPEGAHAERAGYRQVVWSRGELSRCVDGTLFNGYHERLRLALAVRTRALRYLLESSASHR
jgi:hypothetical protein